MDVSGMENINKISEKQARKILIALCEHDRQIREKTSKILRHVEAVDAIKSLGGTKRKLEEEEKLHLCIQCNVTYTESINDKKACRFHDDELEVDYESSTWDDWDERCHGPIGDPSFMEVYPDGFVWTCCDREGTADGCRVGYHRSRQEPIARKSSFKPRDEDEDDDDDEEDDESDLSEEDSDLLEDDEAEEDVETQVSKIKCMHSEVMFP